NQTDTSTVSGVTGTFSATLNAFDLKITTLSGNFSIASDGSFSLSVTASFTLSSFVDIDGTLTLAVDKDHHITMSVSASFSVFDMLKGTISGSASSLTNQWQLSGTATANLGDDDLGASLSASVTLGNENPGADGIHLSGKGWAEVKVSGIK